MNLPFAKTVLVVLLAAVLIIIAGLFVYNKVPKSQPPLPTQPPAQQQVSQPTPSITPITQSNVDQAISSQDQAIQSTLDQVNTDLGEIDSVSGLDTQQ